MKKRDRIILQKIVGEINLLSRLTSSTDMEGFLANEELMRATCMTLINIGELVKNLSDEFRLLHPAIPWKDMAGLRDVTAHGYFTLRMDDIWIYAIEEMPSQAMRIQEILNQS